MQQIIDSNYTSFGSYVPVYIHIRRKLKNNHQRIELEILTTLAEYADPTGVCFPGVDEIADNSHYAPETVEKALVTLFEMGYVRACRFFISLKGKVRVEYQVSPWVMYIRPDCIREAVSMWEQRDMRIYVPAWERSEDAPREIRGRVTKRVMNVGQPTTEPSLNNQKQRTNSRKPTTTTDPLNGKTQPETQAVPLPPADLAPTPKKTKTKTAAVAIPSTSEITSTVPKQAEIATTAAKPQRTSPQIQVPPSSVAPSPAETGAEAMKRRALAEKKSREAESAPTPSTAVSEPNDPNVGVTEAEIDQLAEQIAQNLSSTMGQMKDVILEYGYHRVKPMSEYVFQEHLEKRSHTPVGLMNHLLKNGFMLPPPASKSITGKYADFFDR